MQEQSILDTLLSWLENSGYAQEIGLSLWLYPATEIIHIAGFAVLVGAAVMYDLRLIGLSRRLPVTEATRHLSRWAQRSLFVVIPSGLTLFAVDATTLAYNPAFQIKLLLLVTAGINAGFFHLVTLKSVDKWNVDTPPPAAARLAGALSILLWLSIISCGRLIAYV